MQPQSIRIKDAPALNLLSWGGTGDPVLLTHGMAGNAHWWDSTAPLLAAFSSPVALDFHGHGDSEWYPDGLYTTERFVEDMEAARVALGWERMILCGHSLGARLALDYAHKYPQRLTGLICIDFMPEFGNNRINRILQSRRSPQPFYDDAEDMVARFHLQPRGTLLGAPELQALARLSLRQVGDRYSWKTDWRAFFYRYPAAWPLLPQIHVPTLMMRGQHSSVMDFGDFHRAVDGIPGAAGVEIPRAFHHVPLDTPRELATEISLFLSSLKQGKAAA